VLFVCLAMNGKGQYYLNIAITLVIGTYGIIGALYSEMLKPQSESNGWAIAFDTTGIMILVVFVHYMLKKSYANIVDDRESRK
jgi:hypothetical protein